MSVPTLSLYIPHSYLKEGANRIIIFETERGIEHIHLTRKPTLKHIKGKLMTIVGCRIDGRLILAKSQTFGH